LIKTTEDIYICPVCGYTMRYKPGWVPYACLECDCAFEIMTVDAAEEDSDD